MPRRKLRLGGGVEHLELVVAGGPAVDDLHDDRLRTAIPARQHGVGIHGLGVGEDHGVARLGLSGGAAGDVRRLDVARAGGGVVHGDRVARRSRRARSVGELDRERVGAGGEAALGGELGAAVVIALAIDRVAARGQRGRGLVGGDRAHVGSHAAHAGWRRARPGDVGVDEVRAALLDGTGDTAGGLGDDGTRDGGTVDGQRVGGGVALAAHGVDRVRPLGGSGGQDHHGGRGATGGDRGRRHHAGQRRSGGAVELEGDGLARGVAGE